MQQNVLIFMSLLYFYFFHLFRRCWGCRNRKKYEGLDQLWVLTWSIDSPTLRAANHNLEHEKVPNSIIISCCSVAESCLTLHNPTNSSTPGSPVLHYFPEFAQIYVHWVGDTMQPAHPLLPPLFLPSNLSQHHDLFQWLRSFPMSELFTSGGQSIGASTSVLPVNKKCWFPLLTNLVSLLSKGLSRVFCNTTVQSINSLVLSLI